MKHTFTVLMYAGAYVDEAKLFEGIYQTATPHLHDANETIANMVATKEEVIGKYMKDSPVDIYISNLKKCKLDLVSVTIPTPTPPTELLEGFVWVKASERKPENKGTYITRRPDTGGKDFVVDNRPFNPKYNDNFLDEWAKYGIEWLSPAHLPIPTGGVREVAAKAFDAGFNRGVDQRNVLNFIEGQIYPDKETYLKSL